MRPTALTSLLAAVVLCCAPGRSVGQVVDLSLNAFPTNLALPNAGGTWNIVAKTSGGDVNLGIAGISAFLHDVEIAGLMVEPDINSILRPGGGPFAGVFDGAVNIVYGQNIAVSPILPGVGLPALSDGPDPLGNPLWDGATRIFSGAYNGVVPSWASTAGNLTGANVLVSTSPGTAAIAAAVTTVVRVQVPEPAAASVAWAGMIAMLHLARRGSGTA